MTKIRHPEYRKELENTKYPFVPTASLSNGTVSFFEGTFLDAHIYAVTGTSGYYISSVIVNSDSITINIGDSAEAALLSGAVSLPIENDVVRLVDSFGRSAGLLVSSIDRLAVLTTWGIGSYSFEAGQTAFCVTCCMPVPEIGVTAIRLESGELLSGKVWLVGDDGVVLQTVQKTDKNGNEVNLLQINVVGDPLFLQKLCNPEDLFTPVNPIRTIRVVQGDVSYECDADDFGNFNIQMNDSLASDAALRIRTTPQGIVFNVEGSTNVGN